MLPQEFPSSTSRQERTIIQSSDGSRKDKLKKGEDPTTEIPRENDGCELRMAR